MFKNLIAKAVEAKKQPMKLAKPAFVIFLAAVLLLVASLAACGPQANEANASNTNQASLGYNQIEATVLKVSSSTNGNSLRLLVTNSAWDRASVGAVLVTQTNESGMSLEVGDSTVFACWEYSTDSSYNRQLHCSVYYGVVARPAGR
jgi:hypothetical protein